MIQKRNSNLTACGYINGLKHIFTIDTGASHSIIRPDIVQGKCEPLNNIRLRTATGEPATVYGKIEVKVTIANISVKHVFIVADIVDEVIIGADFMISHSISLNMGQQVMTWRNVEIALDVGYDNQTHVRRLVAVGHQKLSPQAETLVWARMEGDCEDNRLWVVEPSEIKNDVITAKALVKTIGEGIVPVRVLNLSGQEKVIIENSKIG